MNNVDRGEIPERAYARPVRVGRMELPNRLVLPPMMSSRSRNHRVTGEMIDYYVAIAGEDSVGLVLTEHAFIAPDGLSGPWMLSIADEEAVEGLSRLTEAVHEKGSRIGVQINHVGAAAKREYTGLTVLGPSLDSGAEKLRPERAMTRRDIERVTEEFALAATRAVRAGFDAVEIHSAHGYLLNEFYSPLTNHREDEYGGDLENRIRFHREVIRAVKSALPEYMTLLLRLGAEDYLPGGSTAADAARAAAIFEKEGVDALDISGGVGGYARPGHSEEGWFSDASLAVREAVSVPVILTGGIRTPEGAEALLREGRADLLGLGRPLMADRDFARRLLRS